MTDLTKLKEEGNKHFLFYCDKCECRVNEPQAHPNGYKSYIDYSFVQKLYSEIEMRDNELSDYVSTYCYQLDDLDNLKKEVQSLKQEIMRLKKQ